MLRVRNLTCGYGGVLKNRKEQLEKEAIMKFNTVKISLVGAIPPVWRRVVFPENITFKELHTIIQGVTNFKSGSAEGDYHLYEFDLEDEKILITNDDEVYQAYKDFKENGPRRFSEDTTHPEQKAFESMFERQFEKAICKPESTSIKNHWKIEKPLTYAYDYGDGWIFEIALEKTQEMPESTEISCIEGVGDAPPEDVGGIPGFKAFLEIRKNPNHPEFESQMEWAKNQGFELFDLELVNKKLKYILDKY